MPARRHSCGSCARVAERVGQPEGLQRSPKFSSKKRWPNTNWRTSDSPLGHIRVVLDPAAADGVELAVGHLALDAVEDVGVVLL